MSGEDQVLSSGVEESAADAGLQSQDTLDTAGAQESPGAADAAETSASGDGGKDFSKALNIRLEQKEKEIREKLEAEYSARRDPVVLNMMAAYGYGDDYERFQADVNQLKQEQEIARQAQQMGLDPDAVREYIMPVNQKLAEYERELSTLREQEQARQFEAYVSQLEGKYTDFGPNKDAIFQLAVDNQVGVEQAYKLWAYDSLGSQVEQVRADVQRDTINKLKQNTGSSPGALGSDAPQHDGSYISMSADQRKAMREANRRRSNTVS